MIMFDEYVSWPEDLPTIHRMGAGSCPLTKIEEEEFFNAFSQKEYSDTIEPIIKYFQKYSTALTKEIWNKQEEIEKDLGGKIDAIMFGDVFMLGSTLAERFDVPFIKFHPGSILDGGLSTNGGIHLHPAQADSIFFPFRYVSMPHFIERMLNYVFYYFIEYVITTDIIAFENNFRKEMNFTLIPDDNNYLKNSIKYSYEHSSLYPIATIVANSPAFTQSVDVPPFVHYVNPILTVPQDIQDVSREKYPEIDEIIDWINNDDRRIILMSLSTVAHFSEDGMNAIVNGLSSLNDTTRVLWVVRDAARHSFPKNFVIPENFHLARFIPQYESLGHDKIKLFFSVGGINSVLESITQGTPILCCGSHFEQDYNCNCIENLGVGLRLDKQSLTADKVRNYALFLLEHPESYSNTIQELGRVFRSGNSTLKAADFIEEAVFIGSNRFLLPRTVHMNFIERASWDIIIVLIIIIYIILKTLKKIIFFIIHLILSFFKNKEKVKQKPE